ncbi:MAG: indolepyruvate oxidoreductase subunit beta family protein [Betaproteobacteria bacterium]
MKAGEPLTILVAALGGQGGGVLTDWIVHAARAQGLAVQATSTPGVSQRTGATTYYIEMAAEASAQTPVFALAPVPGRVDVLVCAELLEAARMLERGMCTPARTTVIASSHRSYTTREKMSGGDGRFDAARVVAAIHALARRDILFDMEDVRIRQQSAISAALFGALVGSGVLPLSREQCEAAIKASGKGVARSLAAFAEARGRAAGEEAAGMQATRPSLQPEPLPAAIATRIATMPPGVAPVARLGAAQVAAFQDAGYAARYLDYVERVLLAEGRTGGGSTSHPVTCEAARHLALWMCYDDVIRVATLKSRAARFARIRSEAGACDGDIVLIDDYFKPGTAEIAAILPRRIGAWLEHRARARSSAAIGGRALTLRTSGVAGLALMRAIAALRPLRPLSLRYAREQQEIDEWLALVERALTAGGAATDLALELARLPRLRKGYGETWIAGQGHFARILIAHRTAFDPLDVDAAQRLRVAVRNVLNASACVPPSPPSVTSSAAKVVWMRPLSAVTPPG